MSINPSARLRFDRFTDSDARALAELLSDPSITRNITCDGSTPERCLASARKRIRWHNSAWNREGYGVWALRHLNDTSPYKDKLLGWCGFTPADGDDPDPEILYAIHKAHRGEGLAFEAARHTISWLFQTTAIQGVTAVIFPPLNPASTALAAKLGMRFRNAMPYSRFLSDKALADEVAEYEVWRLGCDDTSDLETLINQTAFRVGQVSTVTSRTRDSLLDSLSASLRRRVENSNNVSELTIGMERLCAEFASGESQAHMDCYHVSREQWRR